MTRTTCARRIGTAFVLVSALSLAPRARAATLVSCAPGASTDPISRAFYLPNYPGTTLGTLTATFASDTTGRYVLTLTARLDTFDGTVLGSATNVADLTTGSPAPVTFVFAEFAARSVPRGHTLAFVVGRQGSGPEVLSFATGASGGCGAVETNDATPPLGTIKGSVPLVVTGDVSATPLGNATFDSSVSGWSVPVASYPATVAFNATDAGGSPSSGSALVTNTTTTTAPSLAFAQGCVPTTGAGAYSYGGKVRIAAGQSSGGSVTFGLGAYPTPDCSGADLLIFDNTQESVPADGTWHAVHGTGTVSAGRGVNSVALMLAAVKNAATGTFAADFDDVFLRPAQVSTLTLPGMASISGQAGAFFHTDLWVLNRSYTQALAVTATFRCYVGLACGLGSTDFTLQPREQQLYGDVLNSLLRASSTAGTLELAWDASLGSISASARTYSPSAPAPTNGTGIPALPSTASRARAVFTGLATNGGDLTAGFRSNVGSYNPTPGTAHVTYSLYDATGSLLGTSSRTAAPNEAFQLNDVFAVVGKGSTVAAGATLVVTSDVPIFSFVTVIDNQTNDSSFILPSDDEAQP